MVRLQTLSPHIPSAVILTAATQFISLVLVDMSKPKHETLNKSDTAEESIAAYKYIII